MSSGSKKRIPMKKSSKKEKGFVPRNVLNPISKFIDAFGNFTTDKNKKTQFIEKKSKIAPLTLPEEASPFLKLYSERYYNLIVRDPKNVKTKYNTVCFLILSMLEDKIDERVCRFLDSFVPITDIKSHMDSFDDDFGMAIQRHRDLNMILNYWQLGALRRYEFDKCQLIAIRRVELFLHFQRDQSVGFTYYINRILEKPCRGTMSQIFLPTKTGKGNFKAHCDFINPDIKCSLSLNNNSLDLPLNEAMAIVTSEKRKLEKQIENSALYLRCIRELIRINEANLAKIYSYQFRWRPTRLSERVQSGRINTNPPMSELRQAFLDSIPR